MTFIYPQQDLDQPAKLGALLGSFWTGPYEGAHEVEEFVTARGQLEKKTVARLDEAIASMSRLKVPVFHCELWYQLILKESEMNNFNFAVPKYGEGFVYGPQDDNVMLQYGAPTVRSIYAFPVPPSLRSAPAIYNRTDLPTVSWTDGLDYVVQNGYLKLLDNPFNNPNLAARDVYVDGAVVDREAALWLFRSQWDEANVWTHCGHILNVYLASSTRYLDLVNSVFDSLVVGSSLDLVCALLAAVTDTPTVIDETETVLHVVKDAVNLLVITNTHVYQCSLNAVANVAVGDRVTRGTYLTQAVRTCSPAYDSKPDWLYAYALDESLTGRKYKGGLVFIDDDQEVAVDTTDAFTRVEFGLQGWAATLESFWNDVYMEGVDRGQTLAHLLDLRPAATRVGEPRVDALPPLINPLQFLLDNVLRNNALFVLLQPSQFGQNQLPLWTLGLIRRIISPHTAVLLVVRLLITEPPITMVGAGTTDLPGGTDGITPYAVLPTLTDGDDAKNYITQELGPASYVDGICV